STTLRRLLGFTTNTDGQITDEIKVIDANGNATDTVTAVDPSGTAKKVTRKTTHPDSSTLEVTVAANGLLTDSTTKTGIHTAYGYDALGRRNATTDPRTGTTTT